MKYHSLNFAKWSALAVAALISTAAIYAQTDAWSKRISSKKERALASLLNPHVSTVNVLIVDGRKFEHVRGLERFYLSAPRAPAIIFMADEKDYSVTYHIFKMDTG